MYMMVVMVSTPNKCSDHPDDTSATGKNDDDHAVAPVVQYRRTGG